MLDLVLIVLGIVAIYVAYQMKKSKEEDPYLEYVRQADMELLRQQTIEENAMKATQNFDPNQQTIYLCYGSQSGTAAQLANVLAAESEEHNLQPRLLDMMDYEDIIMNDKNVCVFLMATHGEGEPTDNAKEFYNYCLRMKEQNTKCYVDMKYTVFGLGKSSYEHFNYMGKWTDQMLQDLGANRVYKFGMGDDMGSLEDDFESWKKDLWMTIKNKTNAVQDSQVVKTKKKNELVFQVTDEAVSRQVDMKLDYEFQTKQWITAQYCKLNKIYELRQNKKDGSTLHLEMDLDGTMIDYETGMNLAIFAKNTEEKVKQISEHLGFNLEQVVRVTQDQKEGARQLKYPFPSPISIKSILQSYVDFQGPMTKKQLKDVAQFCRNNENKEELLGFANDKKLFNQHIEKKKKGLLDILIEYDIKLGLKDLVQISSRIGPRLYTISSSRRYHEHLAHVTASLAIDDDKVGLASQYFLECQQQIEQGKSVQILVDFRRSNFVLPEDVNKKVLMIGPGAGIAPFRGFMWENQQRQKLGMQKYQMTLYFGCRYQEGDYIYKDEIEYLQQVEAIEKYYVAFSRQNKDKRVYVQDLIEQNKQEVKELVDQGGVIYICGNTQMGADVQKILIDILKDRVDGDQEKAHQELLKLEQNKQYIKELWG